MTEEELRAIEIKLPWDVPGMADALTSVRARDIHALIAEVRRLRELVEDEAPIYCSTDELRRLQQEKNRVCSAVLDALSTASPTAAR